MQNIANNAQSWTTDCSEVCFTITRKHFEQLLSLQRLKALQGINTFLKENYNTNPPALSRHTSEDIQRNESVISQNKK